MKIKKIEILLVFLLIVSLATTFVGSYIGLISSPPDSKQGDAVRIMYIHVPTAMWSLMAYTIMALVSFIYLWTHKKIFHLIANAIAPIGMIFTILCLITGSIWGKPMWGTYWTWDPRLTSELILLFIYIAYLAINIGLETLRRKATILAVWTVIGAVNIPIIKFSVTWWHSIHQGSSMIKKGGGSAIDPSMQTPLYIMIIGITLLFITLSLINILRLINEEKNLKA